MSKNISYVESETAKFEYFYQRKPEKIYKSELLWGDRVEVLGKGRKRSESKVRARGKTGYVKKSDLGDTPLLEVYFIDVGQGDGVLIVTPDRRHIFIDGGWPRRSQPTGKNAVDFVDWKFDRDYGEDSIRLDTVMCSHNDQDHYGGLWDLFNPDEEHELGISTKNVTVEKFFHAGLSHWRLDGKNGLGETVKTEQGKYFVDLIDSRSSVVSGLKSSANPKLRGEWAKFLRLATKIKTADGKSMPMFRLGSHYDYVPGYEPESSDVSMRVLAPVNFSCQW